MLDSMQHKSSGADMLEKFIETDPQKAAQMLETIPLSEAVFWVSSLKSQSIITCLEKMTPKKAAVLLRRLPFKQASRIILGINAGAAGEIMLALPLHYKKRLVDSLDETQVKALEEVLSYPKDSAARYMNGFHLSFKTDSKVKDIIARIKPMPKNKTPFCVFILDKANRLAGIIKTSDLALYPQDSVCGSVMLSSFDKLGPFISTAKALEVFKTSACSALPVVDGDGFLLGTVNLWDILPALNPARSSKEQSLKTSRKKIIMAFVLGAMAMWGLFLIFIALVNFGILKI